jgi:hypothetical protein
MALWRDHAIEGDSSRCGHKGSSSTCRHIGWSHTQITPTDAGRRVSAAVEIEAPGVAEVGRPTENNASRISNCSVFVSQCWSSCVSRLAMHSNGTGSHGKARGVRKCKDMARTDEDGVAQWAPQRRTGTALNSRAPRAQVHSPFSG